MTRHRRRPRGEDGTAIVEFVWLAVLLLIPMVYVVLAVFDTQRAAYAASAAARSAGRAFVTAPTSAEAYRRAEVAARLAYDDQRLTGPVHLRIRCSPTPDACLTPGSVVTAEVSGTAVLPLMPVVFGDHAPRLTVSAEHSSPYGTYRAARP
ncbi:hypothetical protein [Nocardioides terrisoli]|uniref:hypothetical protein n=1 Tax=Nocardioides terrisoli TaxID=3388267 RepID=UPI00287BC145|nr:hypothetical protein [Nocardioides marmorisolisilvae]